METLVAWYESKYHNQGQLEDCPSYIGKVLNKSESRADEAPRLAIYFEDLETFDSVVLTNLIEILR